MAARPTSSSSTSATTTTEKDPTFGKYPKLVRTTMNQLGKLIKPSAQLIYRTTNVGHHKCENASRPLRSRLAAWEKLTETGTSVWEWNTRKSARRRRTPRSARIARPPRSIVPPSLITTAAGSIQLRNGTARAAARRAPRRRRVHPFYPAQARRRSTSSKTRTTGGGRRCSRRSGRRRRRARPTAGTGCRAQRVVHGRARRRPRGGGQRYSSMRFGADWKRNFRSTACTTATGCPTTGRRRCTNCPRQRQVRGRIKP